jgi:hypothetical protein
MNKIQSQAKYYQFWREKVKERRGHVAGRSLRAYSAAGLFLSHQVPWK